MTGNDLANPDDNDVPDPVEEQRTRAAAPPSEPTGDTERIRWNPSSQPGD
jgi:hypothetical protein